MLDLKELLISFDRHLITCLIANQVQGNATPHPCTVLSSFLHHLAQSILLIIAPPGTDDAPPFLHHPEIYGIEFWHAHLNYACTRFAASHGSDRLLGNQICHWTTGTSETCLKVTHLVVFLPPALGAYVLSQHRTKVSSSLSSADDVSTQDEPHTLRINQSSPNRSQMLAVAPLKVALLPTPSPSLPIHRHDPVKIGSLGPSNSRCPRPQRRAPLADFLQFREGMAQAGHMPLKGRCVTHNPSTTNMKPPHFSPTLTSSPCLIMSPNMAPFGLKLLGCTSQTPSKNGFSPVRLASMIARTLSFQAIARLLSRPS